MKVNIQEVRNRKLIQPKRKPEEYKPAPTYKDQWTGADWPCYHVSTFELHDYYRQWGIARATVPDWGVAEIIDLPNTFLSESQVISYNRVVIKRVGGSQSAPSNDTMIAFKVLLRTNWENKSNENKK